MIYTTEEQAFRRAETIRLQGKWWPGVIRHRDGTFELTYDPLDQVAPDLPSAPNSELGWERARHTQREADPSRGNLTNAPRTPSPLPGGRMLP